MRTASMFSAAAERLFTTQPAITYQINALEKETGLHLFERTTRRTKLTAAGQQLETLINDVLDMSKKRILGVIGLGHVGAHVAYALAVQGIRRNMQHLKEL